MKRCRHPRAGIRLNEGRWFGCYCPDCGLNWWANPESFTTVRGMARKPPRWVQRLYEEDQKRRS